MYAHSKASCAEIKRGAGRGAGVWAPLKITKLYGFLEILDRIP